MTFWWTAGAGLTLAFFLFYFIVGLTRGFGGRDEPWEEYCEHPGTGLIKQPVCFWSNIAFILSGMAALLWIDFTPTAPRANLMATATAYSVPLGLLTLWLGPGSMLEHGTLRRAWGWFDAASIHWYAFYVIQYIVFRWAFTAQEMMSAGPIVFFLVVQAAAMTGLGFLTHLVPASRMIATVILIALMGLALVVPEITQAAAGWPSGLRRQGFWLIGAAIFAVIGFIALFGSRKGAFLCPAGAEHNTFRQFHGLWHLCMAATTFFVTIYLRSEA